jgi:hypothetical protein
MLLKHGWLVLAIAAFILLSGCALDRECSAPSDCNESATCLDGACVLKPGCEFDNPPCEQDYVCTNNTCVLKPGCDYNNPPCPSDFDCLNNTCVKKQGCLYGNPPCDQSHDCISNECVLKQGCDYNNPPCGSDYNCISNQCILKPGCQYNNPPCNTGYVCRSNQCLRFLTPTERSEILGFVSSFEASRNQQVQYSSGYGAEEACRRFTGIYYYKQSTGKDTLTLQDAAIACQMVNTNNPGACGYPALVGGTLQFGLDTFNIENNLTAFHLAFSDMTPENTVGKLAEARGYVLGARASASSAAASLLRYDLSCAECLGICPLVPYDIASLDAAAGRLH